MGTSLKESFKEYVRSSGYVFWAVLVGIMFAVTGAVLDATGVDTFPLWTWMLVLFASVAMAPFWVFHKIRFQRDELMERLDSRKRNQEILDGIGRLVEQGGYLLRRNVSREGELTALENEFHGWLDEVEQFLATHCTPGELSRFRVRNTAPDSPRVGDFNQGHTLLRNNTDKYLSNLQTIFDHYYRGSS